MPLAALDPSLPIHELARGDGWIVVAKPPRVIVHRSRHTRDEYAALQDMYRELESLTLELEAIEDTLGGYRWESPGTVTGFYVHW